MYLLDTNVVSEFRKPRPHGAVVAWITAANDADLNISAVTFGEIQKGIERTRMQDADKAAAIERWSDKVADTYNVLPMTSEIFRLWAKLMHKQTDTVTEDAMIAATAIVNELTVVTRNVNDFERFGVKIINPFAN
jgi:toxin FitB